MLVNSARILSVVSTELCELSDELSDMFSVYVDDTGRNRFR